MVASEDPDDVYLGRRRHLTIDKVTTATKKFGETLRFYRTLAKLKVRDFKEIGVSASRISRWEADLLPKPETKEILHRLAKKLADNLPNSEADIFNEFIESRSSELVYKRTTRIVYGELARRMTGASKNREMIEQLAAITAAENGTEDDFSDNVRRLFPEEFIEAPEKPTN